MANCFELMKHNSDPDHEMRQRNNNLPIFPVAFSGTFSLQRYNNRGGGTCCWFVLQKLVGTRYQNLLSEDAKGQVWNFIQPATLKMVVYEWCLTRTIDEEINLVMKLVHDIRSHNSQEAIQSSEEQKYYKEHNQEIMSSLWTLLDPSNHSEFTPVIVAKIIAYIFGFGLLISEPPSSWEFPGSGKESVSQVSTSYFLGREIYDGSWIEDHGSWIKDRGSWTLDFVLA